MKDTGFLTVSGRHGGLKVYHTEQEKNRKDFAGVTPGINIGIPQTLLMSLFVLVASVYIPFAVFSGTDTVGRLAFGFLSYAMAALGVVMILWIARSLRFILSYILILVALFLFAGSAVLPGIVSAFVSSVLVYAFTINKKPTLLLAVIPILAYSVSYFICGSFLRAALCLFFYPPAIMLALSVKTGASRVASICRISAGIALCFIAVGLGYVFIRNGSVSLDIIDETLEHTRTSVINALTNALVQAYEAIGYDMSVNDAASVSTTLVTGIFNVLPAIFVICCNITAFFIQSLYVAVMIPYTDDREVIRRSLTFNMSLTSATVFIVAYFMKAVLSADSTLVYAAAAENISLILEPGLALTALLAVRAFLQRKGPSCSGVLLYFLLLMLFLNLPGPMLSLASFGGAIFIIVSAVREHMNRKAGG